MMTNVKIYRNKEKRIVRYKVYGHSKYSEAGTDIVCAAVSAVVQTAALGLIGVAGIKAEYETGDAYFECILPEDMDETLREKARVILETMILGIREFQDQYSRYIRIFEVEV